MWSACDLHTFGFYHRCFAKALDLILSTMITHTHTLITLIIDNTDNSLLFGIITTVLHIDFRQQIHVGYFTCLWKPGCPDWVKECDVIIRPI